MSYSHRLCSHQTTTDYDEEVLIKGRWYNVTDFVNRHPGGRILNFYRGKDATEPFVEFHTRSKKADKMLESLKVCWIDCACVWGLSASVLVCW